MVTHEFKQFHEKLSQCNWYEFPRELQRMLVIVLINTQEPATIKGFANTSCTREEFKKVSVLNTCRDNTYVRVHHLLLNRSSL